MTNDDPTACADMEAPTCPVCASPFTAYVRTVPTIRTRQQIRLYTCLDCHSFWNPSDYRETDRVLELDLEWGRSVGNRNLSWATVFFAKLATLGVDPRSVCEVGCGIGSLLTVARGLGIRTVGFDANRFAVRHAAEVNGLDVRAELWNADTVTDDVDLFLSISVLEHLDRPRPLIEELCRAASKNRAALFVSVPFLERSKWHHLLDPDPATAGTPFFDNDVHVTHFSIVGLMTALKEFGQQNLQFVPGVGHGWSGVLALPD